MAIIGVADRPTILRDYTTDQQQLQDGVGKVFAMPGVGATLLDAISKPAAACRSARRIAPRWSIVTTENIEFSPRHYREVLEALERGGAQLHAVILNTPAGSALDDPARNRASVLDLGPKNSGGTRIDVLTSQAFEGKLQELAAILKSQHRVVYARPQTLIPPEKIEVSSAKPASSRAAAPPEDNPSGSLRCVVCRVAASVAASAVRPSSGLAVADRRPSLPYLRHRPSHARRSRRSFAPASSWCRST